MEQAWPSICTTAAGQYLFMQDSPYPPRITPEPSQNMMSRMPASSMSAEPGWYHTEIPYGYTVLAETLRYTEVAPNTEEPFAASLFACPRSSSDSRRPENHQYMAQLQVNSNSGDQNEYGMAMIVGGQGMSVDTLTTSHLPTSMASTDDRTKQFTWDYSTFKGFLQTEDVNGRSAWLCCICGSCAKEIWIRPGRCEDLDHQLQYQAVVDVVKEWLKEERNWKKIPKGTSPYLIQCWCHNMPCPEQEHEASQASYTLTSSQNFTRDEMALIWSLKRHNAQSRQATYHNQAAICRSCAKKKWDSQGKDCTDKDHLAHHKAAVAVIAEWLEKSQRWEKMPKILNAYHIWHWFHDMECVESRQRFDQNAHTKRLRRIREQEQRDQDRTAPLRRILPKPGPNAII